MIRSVFTSMRRICTHSNLFASRVWSGSKLTTALFQKFPVDARALKSSKNENPEETTTAIHNPLSTVEMRGVETEREKCERLIELVFGKEDEIIIDTKSDQENAILQATTEKENGDTTLEQKLEKIEEPAIVEAEKLNLETLMPKPAMLGNKQDNVKPGTAWVKGKHGIVSRELPEHFVPNIPTDTNDSKPTKTIDIKFDHTNVSKIPVAYRKQLGVKKLTESANDTLFDMTLSPDLQGSQDDKGISLIDTAASQSYAECLDLGLDVSLNDSNKTNSNVLSNEIRNSHLDQGMNDVTLNTSALGRLGDNKNIVDEEYEDDIVEEKIQEEDSIADTLITNKKTFNSLKSFANEKPIKHPYTHVLNTINIEKHTVIPGENSNKEAYSKLNATNFPREEREDFVIETKETAQNLDKGENEQPDKSKQDFAKVYSQSLKSTEDILENLDKKDFKIYAEESNIQDGEAEELTIDSNCKNVKSRNILDRLDEKEIGTKVQFTEEGKKEVQKMPSRYYSPNTQPTVYVVPQEENPLLTGVSDKQILIQNEDLKQTETRSDFFNKRALSTSELAERLTGVVPLPPSRPGTIDIESLPLSVLLRIVRERSRQQTCREIEHTLFMQKTEPLGSRCGDKKPTCPPPTPPCPPPPKCPPPPPPCPPKPKPKKCPPKPTCPKPKSPPCPPKKKKDPCAKIIDSIPMVFGARLVQYLDNYLGFVPIVISSDTTDDK